MDNFLNFLATNNIQYIPVIFLLGLIISAILNKFIPDFIIFTIAGFCLNKSFGPAFTLINSLNLFNYYIFLMLFFIGLNFPWQEVNLIRRKLYRCCSGIYTSMLALVILTLVILVQYSNYLPTLLKNNLFIFPYLALLLFSPDIFQLQNKLIAKKAKGPLTVFSKNISLLLNILTIFILLFSFHDNTLKIWTILFTKIVFILLLSLLLQNAKLSEDQRKLFLIAALFIFSGSEIHSTTLLPFLCGILLSFSNKKNKYSLSDNSLNILNSIAYFLAGQFFVFSAAALLLGFSVFLFYQFVFRLICYVWGRWELNESIYRNMGGVLANPGLIPILLLFAFHFEKINSLNFSLLLSSALFFKLFCFIIWYFESNCRLVKAGESDRTEK